MFPGLLGVLWNLFKSPVLNLDSSKQGNCGRISPACLTSVIMASILSSAGQNRRKNNPREAAWDRVPILHCSDCQRLRSPFSEHVYMEGSKGVEKEMATHSSVLAWRIPGTGKPGGLLSMGLQRVGHD